MAYVVAVVLGQPVDRAGRHRRRRRIPPRAIAGVADPERAGQIDDAHAGVDQRRRQLGRGGFRHRQERDVDGVRELRAVERLELAVPHAGQPRHGPGRRVGRRGHRQVEPDVGMPGEQRDQFLAGEARRPRNPHLQRVPRRALVHLRLQTLLLVGYVFIERTIYTAYRQARQTH
jgi:hypothetical protein